MSRAVAPALVTAADLMDLDADSEALAGDKRKGFIEGFEALLPENSDSPGFSGKTSNN